VETSLKYLNTISAVITVMHYRDGPQNVRVHRTEAARIDRSSSGLRAPPCALGCTYEICGFTPWPAFVLYEIHLRHCTFSECSAIDLGYGLDMGP